MDENDSNGGRCVPPEAKQEGVTNSQSARSDKLVLSETGTGDINEFTSKLDPASASFGFVRVKYANDDHSFREKFALVIWIGEDVKVMRRAKVSPDLATCSWGRARGHGSCAWVPLLGSGADLIGFRPHRLRQGRHPQLRRRDLGLQPQ